MQRQTTQSTKAHLEAALQCASCISCQGDVGWKCSEIQFGHKWIKEVSLLILCTALSQAIYNGVISCLVTVFIHF